MVHSSRGAIGRRVRVQMRDERERLYLCMHESYSSLKSFDVYGEYMHIFCEKYTTSCFYLSKSAIYGLLGTDLPDVGFLAMADVGT